MNSRSRLHRLRLLYNLYKLYKKLKENERKMVNRTCWVREIYLSRDWEGYFATTFLQMKEVDSQEFFKNTRMSRSIYDSFVNLMTEYVTKHSPRPPIASECRLALTLTYLSQGVSMQYLAWTFKMGKSTVREIILETCELIWTVLAPIYVRNPSHDDYLQIAEDFALLWDMPHCIGAIDGKHVNIICPPKSGSQYFNYKKSFSIVLMAVCDANYCFTHVDVGSFGSQSDGGIFRKSKFGSQFFDGQLPIPRDSNLPKKNINFPYYFVGDAAFPLKKNLMRPFPGKHLSTNKAIFNYRLSRARRTIENAFGILVARWRVLTTTLNCHPKNAEKIVLACITLHNFIKMNEKRSSETANQYCPQGFTDWENSQQEWQPGAWRIEADTTSMTELTSCGSNRSSRDAYNLRDALAHYFVNEGSVPFQYNKI